MAAGNIKLQSNDLRIATVTFEDGAVGNVSVVVPKEGGVLASEDYAVAKVGDVTKSGVMTFTSPPIVDGKQVSTGQRKNYLINGNFDSWQYATSQTTSGYGSDNRWINVNSGSTKTHSQIVCTDTEKYLFNSSKFSRTVVSSVAGASNFVNKQQTIENVDLMQGKTVTLSFWAKADSNKNIALHFRQNFGTGGSPSAEVNVIALQLIALTTTWQKKTVTVTLPSIAGKILGTDGVHTSYTNIIFSFDSGSATSTAILGQQTGTFDIAQVKIEDGSVATEGWHPYDGEFGGELQACQRYLPVIYAGTTMSGYCVTPTQAYITALYPLSRIAPTGFTVTSQGGTFWNTTGSSITGTALSSGGNYSKNGGTLFPSCAGGLVAGQGTLYKSSSDILFTGCEL